MKGEPTIVLFDLGATRPFVFLALSKRFGDAPGKLDYLLEVDITDDHPIRVLRVHRGCVMELFHEWYTIDLVHIPLGESKVIVGMDWL